MSVRIILALCLICLQTTKAAYCSGKPDPNAKQNLNPIYTASPTKIKSVVNGHLYTIGQPADNQFYIVHVWGTPYDMGKAHGQLLDKRTNAMINSVWKYLEEQVIGAINSTVHIFKPWFLKDVADFGLDAALDLEIEITRPFTRKAFFEEAQGLADGSGADFKKILRIHMIGELTKGDCSMFGAWGKSVPVEGSLLQLRALDWSVDGPFKDFPQVTVYHPTEGNGHAFANFGWTGWIGSITGMSSKNMAISEIGVTFPDETFGKESRFGVPFTYLLRDILQFDNTIDDSINRIANSQRTCDLILGVGDGKMGEFRGIQYSSSVANFMDDVNMKPTASWHPQIKDVVYWGMDWLCPAFSQTLSRQLTKHYGNITVENVIRDVTSITQTGNLHIAIYDLTNSIAYLANAKSTNQSGPLYAYERSFVKLNMTELFNVIPPEENST